MTVNNATPEGGMYLSTGRPLEEVKAEFDAMRNARPPATLDTVSSDVDEAQCMALHAATIFEAICRDELTGDAVTSVCEMAAIAMRHVGETYHERALDGLRELGKKQHNGEGNST